MSVSINNKKSDNINKRNKNNESVGINSKN